VGGPKNRKLTVAQWAWGTSRNERGIIQALRKEKCGAAGGKFYQLCRPL